jgi:hypothetical protein
MRTHGEVKKRSAARLRGVEEGTERPWWQRMFG